jgi:hypothetical protein
MNQILAKGAILMPILAFSPEELFILSNFADQQLNFTSPLKDLYMGMQDVLKKDAYKTTVSGLVSDGSLKPVTGGKLDLNQDLKPVLKALNTPLETIRFFRRGRVDILDTCFCRVGYAWVRYTVSNNLLQTIVYPYVPKDIIGWFGEELLLSLAFSGSALDESETSVSMDEAVTLVAMQHFYAKRKSQGTSLSGDGLWMNMAELGSPETVSSFSGSLVMIFPPEQSSRILGDTATITGAAEALCSKGMLIKSEKGYAYSEKGRYLFDPGNVQETVQVANQIGNKVMLKALHILKNGYLITSHEEKQPAQVRLITVSPGRDGAYIFAQLFPVPAGQEVSKTSFAGFDTSVQESARRFCRHCGNDVQPGEGFCRNCGKENV